MPSSDQATQPARSPARSMRRFVVFWLGAVISGFGSGMTYFALGVWVFEQTGSVTRFALVGLFGVVPALLCAPFAGIIVDRCRRKRILIVCDLLSALKTMVMAVCALMDSLELWNLGWGALEK